MDQRRVDSATRDNGASARPSGIAHMTRLRDLIRFERSPGLQLPAWLDRVISLGIVTRDPKVARRQKIVNVASFAATFNSISRVIVAPEHEQWGFVSDLQVTSGILAILAISLHRLHRLGENVAAIGLLIWFMISVSFATLFLGSTQVRASFVLIGVVWFLFGLENWRQSIVATIVLFAMALIVMRYAPEQGIAVGSDRHLATTASLQLMINAMIIITLLIVYALVLLQRAENDLERQSQRAETLLSVVLPERIADRLRAHPDSRVADRVDRVSVLFADLAGFTEAAHERPPEEVVAYLDELVQAFDAASEKHGVEKIKTVGDAYMAAGGLEGDPRAGAIAVGMLALEMMNMQASRPPLGRHRLQLRIGLHTGPAIAGVIGDTRISYDLWGDAVNVASRMETHGVPGRIQVSEEYRALAGDAFVFEERGATEIKGLGRPRTHFLLDVGNASETSRPDWVASPAALKSQWPG